MGAVPVVFLGVVFLIVVLGLALGVVLGLRTRARRQDGWQALATRRGLTFSHGDPLGLADDLRSQIVMTLHGRVGSGRPVALVGHRDPTVDDSLSTTPAAVAWTTAGDLDAVAFDRLCRPVRSARHGDLVVVRAPMRFRTASSTATPIEAEATLDDLLRRLPR